MSLKTDYQSLLQELERLQQSSTLIATLMADPGRAIALLSPDRKLVWANDTLATWFPHYNSAGPATVCHVVLNSGSDTFCVDCPALRCIESGSR